MNDGTMFILRSLRDKEVAAPNCTDIKATPKAKKEGKTVLKLGSHRKSKEKNEKKSTKQLPDYLKSEATNEYTLIHVDIVCGGGNQVFSELVHSYEIALKLPINQNVRVEVIDNEYIKRGEIVCKCIK